MLRKGMHEKINYDVYQLEVLDMKWFHNMKIASKLITGFIIVALIACIVGVTGLVNLNAIQKADTLLYEENTLGLAYAGNAAIYYQRIRFNAIKFFAFSDDEIQQTCVNNIKNYSAKADEYLKLYEDGIITEEDRNQFDELNSHWKKYKPYIDEFIQLIQTEQTEEAENLLLGDIAITGDALQGSFDKIFGYNMKGGETRAEQNAKLASTSVTTMIAVIIAGVIIALFLGIFISRAISKPITKMMQTADRLAAGDVNVNVEMNTKDEVGSLARAFNKMIENIRGQAMVAERIADGDLTVEVPIRSEADILGKSMHKLVEKNNEVLSNIASASEQVASGSKQVSDSSIALSQGATEQASSIEQLTASLEEISSQTRLNAQNANNANELAENAKSNALQGDRQMQEMLKAMEDINESSANISKIIKVIDDIAFQTNILALNAAVEAARAGQHGKGFAVVAEEVRNLAARSANAAKETTDMIEGSIKKSEGGTRIAKETAQALNKIVEGIDKVAGLVNNIAVASNEQASGIEQINQGIMQVSQVVQTNSATSEESAAASEELSSQAVLLKEMVGKFKLKHNTVRTYGKLDELNPDVIKMLEELSDRKKRNRNQLEEIDEEFTPAKSKIALSDNEFGKY